MKKIYIALYYIIFKNLPNSRYLKIINVVRVWYVSRILRIMAYDNNSIFENSIYISDCSNIRIGNHCHINEGVFIQGCYIGDYVMIAPNVSILNISHIHSDISRPMITQGTTERSNPIIENDVWIGRNAVILPGVTIGRGSIVGAGAVVTKNIPPFSLAVGVPAKVIKSRDQ